MNRSGTGASGRQYAVTLIVLAVGAVTLLWAYGLPWGVAQVPLLAGASDTARTRELSGADMFPAVAGAGWVALASVAGIVATRSWGRVASCAVAILAGLAGAAAAVAYAARPGSFVEPAAGAGAAVSSTLPTGWATAIVAGAAVVAAGGTGLLRGRGWPVLGTRYERAPRADRRLSAWEAQDRGQDPTDDLVE